MTSGAGGAWQARLSPPPARDPRMDRPREIPDRPGWQVLVLPDDTAPGPARRVRITRSELRRWRVVAMVAVAASLASWIALAFAWPRSDVFDEVFDENVELRQRIDAIDTKMSEVDRILLRLRLYDAQLDTFAEPKGDHGPLPVGADAPMLEEMALDELPVEGLDPDDAAGDGSAEGELEEGGYRSAPEWAAEVETRLTSFLATFHRVEPQLSRTVEDLEEVRALRAALPSVWPSDGVLTSDYGWRRSPFGRKWTHHSGIDIGGQRGFAVRAAAPGRVVLADWDQGYGKAVRIDHGFGIQTLYGHNSALFVKAGDRVEAGQRIAAMGSTGRSTGPHLHFELSVDGHVVDPLDYLELPASALPAGGQKR